MSLGHANTLLGVRTVAVKYVGGIDKCFAILRGHCIVRMVDCNAVSIDHNICLLSAVVVLPRQRHSAAEHQDFAMPMFAGCHEGKRMWHSEIERNHSRLPVRLE